MLRYSRINMKRIILKKIYNFFADFNKDGQYLAEYIKNRAVQMNDAEKIQFARTILDKTTLNSCIAAGRISENVKKLLGCYSYELKFSMDNMIKNRLTHPEITDEDYAKIPLIIKSPSKYLKSKNEYDVILFKEDEKYYKLVIKTTKNKKENFVKSLHLLNAERYNKY